MTQATWRGMRLGSRPSRSIVVKLLLRATRARRPGPGWSPAPVSGPGDRSSISQAWSSTCQIQPPSGVARRPARAGRRGRLARPAPIEDGGPVGLDDGTLARRRDRQLDAHLLPEHLLGRADMVGDGVPVPAASAGPFAQGLEGTRHHLVEQVPGGGQQRRRPRRLDAGDGLVVAAPGPWSGRRSPRRRSGSATRSSTSQPSGPEPKRTPARAASGA